MFIFNILPHFTFLSLLNLNLGFLEGEKVQLCGHLAVGDFFIWSAYRGRVALKCIHYV